MVNCDFCGRDTNNKSRICKVCMRGSRDHNRVDEEPEDEERDQVDDMVYDAMNDLLE